MKRLASAAWSACCSAAARGAASLPRWSRGTAHELPAGASVPPGGLLALNTLRDNPGAKHQARRRRHSAYAAAPCSRSPR